MRRRALHFRNTGGSIAIQPNTFIGGVASSISDAATLASRLNIAEDDISYFAVNGNDIETKIDIDYIIPDEAFLNDLEITYYNDVEGKVTFIDIHAFQRFSFYEDKLEWLYFPNATGVDAVGPWVYRTNLKYVYIPSVLNLGDTNENENIFEYQTEILTVYANPSLATSNNGELEGDLQAVLNNGGRVKFVDDFTPPSAVADLSIGVKYATALQLIFTEPVSANNVDFYEVWSGNTKLGEIKESGEYVKGLDPDTEYQISLITVDEFYNKSQYSDVETVSTNAVEGYNPKEINSYYFLDTNAKDFTGAKDGTATDVTYSGGYAVFNGSTSKIKLPANVLNNPTEFSYSFLVQANATDTEYRVLALNENTGGPYTVVKINQGGTANKIQFEVYDGAIRLVTISTYTVTNLIHITATAVEDGIIALYVNGTLIGSTAIGTFTQTSGPGNHLGATRNGTPYFNGKMKGVALWNKALTDSEASAIATKQLAGEQLI